jgi:hypothetical protein
VLVACEKDHFFFITLSPWTEHYSKGISKTMLQSLELFCVRHLDYCYCFMKFASGAAHSPKTMNLEISNTVIIAMQLGN